MDPNLDYSFDPEFDPDILTQYLREGIDYELVDVEENVENIPPEPIDKVQPKKKKARTVSKTEDTITVPKNPGEKKYRFKAVFTARNFKGQKQGENVGDVLITGDSINDVTRETWDFAARFIKREVYFKYPDEASSSTNLEICIKETEPSFDDIDKFVIYNDKISKRYYAPSSLSSSMLHSWFDKDVNVYIYKYSVAVTSSQQWDRVKAKQDKPSHPDRSGAPSNVALAEVVAKLKEEHKEHFVSDEINWSIWATYVLKQPDHLRSKLIKSGPPDIMIRLFRPVPLHPETVLEKTKQELKIARNVVDFFDDELKDLRTCNNNLRTIAEQIDGRISAMEKKVVEYRQLLNSVSDAVSPQESSFSKSLAEELTDCVDVDHEC